jgi:glucose-1-phosphate adenylyltransferase
MGVYVFTAQVLEELLLAQPGWIDFGKEIIPGALKSHKVFAHMFKGFWEDIGTVRSYFEVSMAMTRHDSPFKFYDGNQMVYTHLRTLPGVTVEEAQLKNTILCEGSRITGATLTDCIVGIRSIVGHGCDIRESILLGAEYFEVTDPPPGAPPIGIGANCRISRAIIDHNARIGKGVEIKGSESLPDHDGDGYCTRDGIVFVLKNAVIKDGTKIG